MHCNGDAERPAESDRRMLGISSDGIPIEVDSSRTYEDPVDVVETAAHDTFPGVSEIEGMTQFVQNGTEGGGQAATVGTPIVAVVHQLLGVDDRGVQKSWQYLSHARGPRMQAGRTEESQSSATQSCVTLSPRQRVLVSTRTRRAAIPRTGEKGQIFSIL